MKLIPICSSSKGNCTYIGTLDSGIVIDMGCSFRAFKTALAAAGSSVEAVRAVLVTHEHSDHIKGLLTLTRQRRIPIFADEGALNYLINHHLVESSAELHTVEELDKVEFDTHIQSFMTPHDACSVGYRLDFSDSSLGFCTDLGRVTDTVKSMLTGCRTIFIEANYQPEMLMKNPNYPAYLKQRIAGSEGHLSNPDSAEFCTHLVENGTVNLILGHLSQENNTPEIAFNTVKNRLAEAGKEYERDYMLRVAKVNNDSGEYVAF